MSSMGSCPTVFIGTPSDKIVSIQPVLTPYPVVTNPAPPPSDAVVTKPKIVPGLASFLVSGYFNDDPALIKKYFASKGEISPFVSGLDASNISTITDGRFTVNGNKQYFTIAFLGFFLAPRSGDYTFYLRSDDSAYVWLDKVPQRSPISDFGTAIIKNPGIHGDDKLITSGPIRMDEGEMRPFTVLYGQGFGGSNLHLAWSGPGTAKTSDFNGVWFHDPRDFQLQWV